MQVPFLDLKAQYQQIEHEVVPLVTEAMAKGAFIGGDHVAGFESEFAEFCQSEFCVGVGSGTDALRFALMACGIGSGDEVITVPNTFIATTGNGLALSWPNNAIRSGITWSARITQKGYPS